MPSAASRRGRARWSRFWNARTELLFYPTFRTALVAGLPWLEYMCPGCRQVGELDLREVDRHPEASISTLIPQLSCRRCCPNSPFAELIRLKARSLSSQAWRSTRRQGFLYGLATAMMAVFTGWLASAVFRRD